MALDAVIFDVDGTLVDTNWAHVEAWGKAFDSCGYKINPDRITVEIGKGGDLLVRAVLGQQAEDRDGEKLRHNSAEEFLKIARREHFKPFPQAEQLLRRLREQGLQVALATSSKVKHLQAILDSARLDLKALADSVITADDAQTSKPAPDLVEAAVAKLGLCATQCAMVGDTPYDAEACRHAGVVCLGVLSGSNSEPTLRRAGARGVWRDTGNLLAHLDEALELASPGPAHLTRQVVEGLMREAIREARAGSAAGELPFGCVLARADGSVLARGQQEVRRKRDRTAHAALVTLARAAGKIPAEAEDLVLVCSLEPCLMCTGAAIECQLDTLVYGPKAPADRGTHRVTPPETGERRMPRILGGMLADEGRAVLQESLKASKQPKQDAWVKGFLE